MSGGIQNVVIIGPGLTGVGEIFDDNENDEATSAAEAASQSPSVT